MRQIHNIDLVATDFTPSGKRPVKATFKLMLLGRMTFKRTIDDWNKWLRDADAIAQQNCSMEEAQTYGEKLGHLLFPTHATNPGKVKKDSGDYQKNYEHVLHALESNVLDSERFIRIRLFFSGAAQLWQIPWEYLLINTAGGNTTESDFLARKKHVSIIRCPNHEDFLLNSPPATKRVIGLFADAGSAGSASLNLGKEHDVMKAALDSDLDACDPPTMTKLEGMLDQQAALFHFAGHGELQTSPIDRRGVIQLPGDDGGTRTIDANRLSEGVAGIRTAVINACEGAKPSGDKEWTNVAEILIKSKLHAVVAMQYKITTQAATIFAKGFYDELAKSNSIDKAVYGGRREILDSLPDGDAERVRAFGAPTLWLHPQNNLDVVWDLAVNDPSGVTRVAMPPNTELGTPNDAAKRGADDAAKKEERMPEPRKPPPEMPPVNTGYEDRGKDVLLRIDDPRLFHERESQQFPLGDLMVVPVLAGQPARIRIYGNDQPEYWVSVQVSPNGDVALSGDWRGQAGPRTVHPADSQSYVDWPRPPYRWQFKFYHPTERLVFSSRVTLVVDPKLVSAVWRIWHQNQLEGDPKPALNFLLVSGHSGRIG